MTSVDVSLGRVWGDAWAVYRLLIRRSVVTAAIVYGVVDAFDFLSKPKSLAISVPLGIVAAVLDLAGPVLVQGALVEIVREIHEARAPKGIAGLYRRALRRLRSLVWASIVYGLGVITGLLLIVPGLLAASRWCLMAPLIMFEELDAGEARAASREEVLPHTWRVLWVVAATFVTTLVPAGLSLLTHEQHLSRPWRFLFALAVSSVTAPFSAHVLTVLYYRLTDPGRPVINPTVRTWRSVWQGA